jgi:hypothetical protein
MAVGGVLGIVEEENHDWLNVHCSSNSCWDDGTLVSLVGNVNAKLLKTTPVIWVIQANHTGKGTLIPAKTPQM